MSETLPESTPAAPAEPVAPATAEATQPPALAAPASPSPTLDPLEVQAELENLRAENAQFAQALQFVLASGGQQADPQAGFDPATLNPLDETFGPNLVNLLQARDQQILGAMQQMFQPVAAAVAASQEAATGAEGEQRLADMLADEIARNGEFSPKPEADKLARAHVRVIAERMFPEVAARYGQTPRAAEIAMARAAGVVRDLLKAAGDAAVAATVNHHATLAGAPAEPGTGGGSSVAATPDLLTLDNRQLALRHTRRP